MDEVTEAMQALVRVTATRVAHIAQQDQYKAALARLGEQITADNVACCQANDNLTAALDRRINR